ncbi:hypothetical protein IFM89_008627 [Coptis chinensis]|uniref:Uncharacterized protein n=1 Tax=Coptis chinensis TaxID=261450 RepID=A0A835GY16_9MAGN|nr:hypothetical protein IFM89_008627 [Coptis chinensis]
MLNSLWIDLLSWLPIEKVLLASCIWTKPDGDIVKLNSDASVTDDHAGTGDTIRDCNGDVLLAYSGSGGTRATDYLAALESYNGCNYFVPSLEARLQAIVGEDKAGHV